MHPTADRGVPFMILLIDNYDSFVHNLGRYLRRLGADTSVVRNDAISVEQIRTLNPQAIVMSPGPCAPQQAGCCLEVVEQLHQDYPILGVCLGHQVIAESFGGTIVRAKQPIHGRASSISHDGRGSFHGLPNSFLVGRYHSLIAERDSLPSSLEISAWLPDGTIMAIRHKQFPVVGWQFHPESVLTEHGYSLLRSFLQFANVSGLDEAEDGTKAELKADELQRAIPQQPDWFSRAIEYPT